jgi:hypothetical protein
MHGDKIKTIMDVDRMILTRENQITRKKRFPSAINSSQISHGLIPCRTRDSAVTQINVQSEERGNCHRLHEKVDCNLQPQ